MFVNEKCLQLHAVRVHKYEKLNIGLRFIRRRDTQVQVNDSVAVCK